MPKILHLGNIANNAYNNAKYLNKSGDIQHHVLNFDNPHIMACPEWEEIDTLEPISEFSPDWRQFNYTPPNWYEYIETSSISVNGTSRLPLLSKITLERRKLAYWLKDRGLKKTPNGVNFPASITAKLRVLTALPFYALLHLAHSLSFKLENQQSSPDDDTTGYSLLSKKLATKFDDFSLTQAYGADIIIPYMLDLPYIAYEHGTLRDLPFDGTARATLLCDAYKNAKTTIITNPDVITSVQKLGLKNYRYIPHAVDCDRFISSQNSLLRNQFNVQDKFVVVAPARQNWDVKGNHKYIEAFAELTNHTASCKLFICDWGQHRDLTKDLVQRLGLSEYVHYYSPCPKITSVHYYQLADIVVDQFEAGAFGGITPEAMACEKPILVYYKPSVHEWCFDSHPPVVNAQSVKEIADALIALSTNKEKRIELGRLGREWVLKEYSTTQLVERHNQIYNQILNTTL